MTTADLLARIDKLGPGRQYPGAEMFLAVAAHVGVRPEAVGQFALDLHLRHIAERLVRLEFTVDSSEGARLVVVHNSPGYRLWANESYAEALVSAAEAVGGTR